MKKNFILLLCIISLISMLLASCNKSCEHTFSDKWYNDAENHWHPATCEHAETERSEFGAHADANEDGLCDVCEYELGHTHTYEEAWSNNDSHHWKNPTCSHEEKGQYATHSDEDTNGTCDVCQGHVHNVNAAGYCKFADCGKKVAEVDETSLDELVAAILVQKHFVNGGSIDYSFDGISNTGMGYYASKHDLINYTYGKDNYLHTFVNNYSLNSGYNTKVPGATDDGLNPFYGENGNWWVGNTDLGVAISVSNAPYLSENGTWIIGEVDTEISKADAYGETPFFDKDGNWWIGETNTGIAIEVNNRPRLGKDGTWIVGGNEDTSTLETWYQLVGPDSVFGVVSESNGALALDLPEAAKLNGYFISMSTLVSEYGVEEILYALYEVAIGDTTDELEVIPDSAENKVVFKYNYKTVFVNENQIVVGDNVGSMVYNVNCFEVQVTFRYSEEYALTDLEIIVDCYTNDPGTADGYGFLYPDVDIEYDPETDTFEFVEYYLDKDGNWAYRPTDKRTPDTYRICVTQTLGERTEENPHPKSKFVPKEFDLYLSKDEDTGVLSDKYEGELMTAEVGDIINFYVGECRPEGTSLHFAQDVVSLKVFLNDVEVVDPEDYMNQTVVAMFTFAGTQRSFFFIAKVDGAYRFEIYLANEKAYEISINVGPVDEKYVPVEDNQFAVKVTDAYSWTTEVSFTATDAGEYFFILPAGIGFINADAYDAAEETEATDDGPIPYFDYNDRGKENGGSFGIVLEEGQTIRFYVNAAKRGTYVITYYTI